MNTVKRVCFGILVGSLFSVGLLVAQDHDHSKHPDPSLHQDKAKAAIERDVTIQGHIIGIVCYTRHASIGEKHLKCATVCAETGIPMGLLEQETGEIFMIFPPGHKNPNEKVMAFLEKDVTVKGTVHRKGGLKGITISEITERKM